jgi:hypothetical protein
MIEYDVLNNMVYLAGHRIGVAVGFEATGVDTGGRRFPCMAYDATRSGFMTWSSINLYRGTKWVRLTTGRRVRLSEAYN